MRYTTDVHAHLDAISKRLTADIPGLDRGDIAALLTFVKLEHEGCCCSLYPDTIRCIPTENHLKRGLHILASGGYLEDALRAAESQFVEVAL